MKLRIKKQSSGFGDLYIVQSYKSREIDPDQKYHDNYFWDYLRQFNLLSQAEEYCKKLLVPETEEIVAEYKN